MKPGQPALRIDASTVARHISSCGSPKLDYLARFHTQVRDESLSYPFRLCSIDPHLDL
jgi:hypothetical protein